MAPLGSPHQILKLKFKVLAWVGRGSLFLALFLFSHSLWAGADYVEGRLLVKMKGQASFHAMNQVRHQKTGDALHLTRSWQSLNMHAVSLKAGQNLQALRADLEADPDVEFVEPDYYLYQQSFGVEPESEISSFQLKSGLGFGGPGYIQSSASIQVDEAWGYLSNYNDHVVVAVIDSGVDYNHPIFKETEAIWHNPMEVENSNYDHDGNGYPGDFRGWNFVSGNSNPMDDTDHGTHVAGIILGAEQNIFGDSLERSRIKIMPLKFLSAAGKGSTSDAIQAIFYAVNNGAHVINASWGGGGYSQALQDAILYAYNNDVFFVAAAGNSAHNNDTQGIYPASYKMPNLLSVAATNDFDYLASFSNYGKESVSLASPGQSILSTLPGGTLGRMSGTSMSAPLAAGIAALMIYENPDITPHQILQVLRETSDRIHQLVPYVASGRVNALSGIQYAQSGDLSRYPAHPPLVERQVASDMGGGCAAAPMLGKLASDLLGRRPAGPSWPAKIGVIFALLSPLLVLWALRIALKSTVRTRRRYERYEIMTDVLVSAGGRQFTGSVSSLSMGGVKIDTSELLDQGGTVHMTIKSPDGVNTIEVSGEIVWSEKEKSYGVAFKEVGQALKEEIGQWQKTLLKAAG